MSVPGFPAGKEKAVEAAKELMVNYQEGNIRIENAVMEELNSMGSQPIKLNKKFER